MRFEALVSVIIPVRNGEAYLGAAIESVLAQTIPPLETIVVDDSSTDGSARVARSFGERVRYTSQPRGGSAAARNRGIQLARGNFFGFLDADDVWLPEKLAIQTAAFAADPELDLAFGLVVEFRAPDEPSAAPHGRRSVAAHHLDATA